MMRWRFRTNWRGQLILQVGWREPKLNGLPGDTYIRWADATTEDLGHYYAQHGLAKDQTWIMTTTATSAL